jgi:predicted O-methyltransferase YrrM
MNSTLEQVLTTRKVIDDSGNTHDLHAEISPDEGELLTELIRRYKPTNTLEIGCAFGVSSLYICEALVANGDESRHTIIDPFQMTDWHGVGKANLRRAGFNFTELIEERSEIALPKFIESGRSFQFALIDGFHTFDQVLVDFYFVNRLLDVGGIVVFDDVYLPGIDRVCRYVEKYPNYRMITPTMPAPMSLKRRLIEPGMRLLSKTLPRSYFNESWLSGASLAGMVAFQKTAEDQRRWDWYKAF